MKMKGTFITFRISKQSKEELDNKILNMNRELNKSEQLNISLIIRAMVSAFIKEDVIQ